MTAYAGILLDLFGTLVLVDPERLPEFELHGTARRTTVGGLLAPLAEWVPGVAARVFAEAFAAVSDEIAGVRTRDHVELPSRERFRRILLHVGCPGDRVAEAAVALSRAHLRLVAGATVLPPAHAELLAALGARYRLAVVSNFDDTATAYDILVRHGIAGRVDAVVVSEAVGLRKPHPAMVRTALRALGVGAGDALLVGDTFAEDVAGAHAAGVDAAWIDARGGGPPPGARPPRWVVRALPELGELLA